MLIKRFIISSILCLAGLSLHAFQLELQNGDGRYGLVDKSSNELILNKDFEKIGWENDQISINGIIRARKNQKWALYDEKGTLLTAHEFTTLLPHNATSFIAGKRASNSILQQYGLIDIKGKTIIPFEFLRLASAGNSLIATYRENDQLTQALYDAKGKSIIRGKHPRINPLNDGFFAVQNKEGLYALHKGDGQALSPYEFQEINPLRSSFFLITYFNRLGVIDAKGKVVVPPIHRRIFQASNEIRTEGYPQWTLFTEENQRNYFFDKIMPIGDSLFVVQTDEHVGVIDAAESYRLYLEDHVLFDTSEKLALIKNINTDLFGLLNDEGAQVLASNYDSLLIFDHFALAKIPRSSGENWFAYTSQGDQINTIGYTEVIDITSFGQVIVSRNGKLGLLSAMGSAQTAFEFESVAAVTEDRFIVTNERGVGLINASGDWLITPYNDSLFFSNDHYRFSQGSAYGITDLNGEQVVKGYEKSYFIPGGYFRESATGYELFDLNDRLVFENEYDTIYALNDKVSYLKRGQKRFFYRHEDQFVANLSSGMQEIGQFQENYIAFKEDDQWGFLDETGKLRIANRYDSVAAFSEGIAPVKLIGKWGAINRKEEIVVQPAYDSIGSFYNALSIVKANGQYGVLDRTGRDVLALKYDLIKRAQDWMQLEIAGLKGISDIRGRIIKTPQYDAIQQLDSDHFLVRKGSKFGVVNRNGKDVVPLSYEEIKASPLGFLALKKGKLNTYPLQ